MIKYLYLLFLAVFIISCSDTESVEGDQVLARVGNERLTLDDARNQIPGFVFNEDSVVALTQYRDEWIQKKVLLQEADRINLAQQRSIQEKMQNAHQEVLVEGLKDYVIKDYEEDLQVSDEEARSYYQANKNQFILNEEFVRFRHVETEDMVSARAAKRELMQGIEWPEVARKYSIDPETKIRQSEQYWPISMALADYNILNHYLSLIGNTEISQIERINGNYHFVQLRDTRAEGEHPELDWLIEQIKDWLLLRKKKRHFSSYVKNLYLKAQSNNEVEIFNILPETDNQNSVINDTLQTNSTNE